MNNNNNMDYLYDLTDRSNHPHIVVCIITSHHLTLSTTTILTLEHLILNFVYEELLYIFTDVASLL